MLRDLHLYWTGVARPQTNPTCFRVRLLFQPAEGGAGTVWMRVAGATAGLNPLRRPCGSQSAGTLGFDAVCRRCGEGDSVRARGDRARPHQAVDAIWLAARVVTELQQAISRRLDALQPVVISFGRVEGGRAFNVIADRVRLLGTVRCLDLDLHGRLPGWIDDTVQAICRSGGGEAEVNYRCIAPPVHNDPGLTDVMERCAVGLLGRDQVWPVDLPSLGAEDFAELLRDVPGTMLRLGVAGPDGCAPLHHGRFQLDERALGVGIQVLTATLLEWMEEQSA